MTLADFDRSVLTNPPRVFAATETAASLCANHQQPNSALGVKLVHEQCAGAEGASYSAGRDTSPPNALLGQCGSSLDAFPVWPARTHPHGARSREFAAQGSSPKSRQTNSEGA